jgi:hypothetical protein
MCLGVVGAFMQHCGSKKIWPACFTETFIGNFPIFAYFLIGLSDFSAPIIYNGGWD